MDAGGGSSGSSSTDTNTDTDAEHKHQGQDQNQGTDVYNNEHASHARANADADADEAKALEECNNQTLLDNEKQMGNESECHSKMDGHVDVVIRESTMDNDNENLEEKSNAQEQAKVETIENELNVASSTEIQPLLADANVPADVHPIESKPELGTLVDKQTQKKPHTKHGKSKPSRPFVPTKRKKQGFMKQLHERQPLTYQNRFQFLETHCGTPSVRGRNEQMCVYCEHLQSDELDNKVAYLLQKMAFFYKRNKDKAGGSGKGKSAKNQIVKRYVCGLKETIKRLKYSPNEVQGVIMSYFMDEISLASGLDRLVL
ncbi:type VI secretion system Vgr family protein [Reticulomyxa filosa]|uniref:Type VI secretion system Vgr family protein n=1 Tax=Reticulomyxa filosa TaxID=46433 RepID=X6P3V7_RETFI|nr:type VI secretion system Vgr family protein [Reticulomyxa filosa]|eukprot:ETO32267.1 type VI secretion system Vgr family protein [Reticulomyxa filosa]